MSIPHVTDGETDLDSALFNPIIDRVNGLADGEVPIPLAGIEGALEGYGPLQNMRAGVANVLDFGPVGTGEHDDTSYLLEAVASNADGLYFPPGLYLASERFVIGSCRAWFGHHWRTTTIRVIDTISAALILGTSGDAINNFYLGNITLDGDYANVTQAVNALQITNGSEPTIERVRFQNWGGGGVLFQGLGDDTGTPDGSVIDCRFDGTGLADGSTGHAIMFKDGSARGVARGNRLKNIMGGMGIAGAGTESTGYPTDLVITANTIRMVASTTGFEAIGIQQGCERAAISANQIYDSQDNGISCSAGHSAVTGNVIDGTQNHGIYTYSEHTTIVGNTVRNVGRDGLDNYGGIAVEAGESNTVVGNTVAVSDSPSNMAYGVKLHNSAGHNLVSANVLDGYTITDIGGSPHNTDVIVRAKQIGSVGALVTSRIYVNTALLSENPPLFIGVDARMGSRFKVGSTDAPVEAGQFHVSTNVVDRPTTVVSAINSQTAELARYEDKDGTALVQIAVGGKLLAHQGVGVGNSASASTLGTVTKKIEVFDASGASIGFLPVYGSIS